MAYTLQGPVKILNFSYAETNLFNKVYTKRSTFESIKSVMSYLWVDPWFKFECPHGNFDSGVTLFFNIKLLMQ